ncbi:MAG: hypothetical protein Q4D55_09825 [Eubacteriales bacterium]|nr:hypothetical protein [Eubacteriales bacterium]
MKEREHLLVTTGIPSLFLIFSVLVLAVLALSSLGASRSDLKTSQVSLQQTTAYFEACGRASDFCAQAEKELTAIKRDAPTPEYFYEKAAEYFSQFEEAAWNPANKTAVYQKTFSDRQSLRIVLSPTFSQKEEGCLSILSWNTAVSDQWESQVTFPVMKSPKKED